MPAQFWVGPLTTPTAHATSFTKATFTTTADIGPTPDAAYIAGSLYTGAVFRVTAWGVVSDTGTPTLNLGVYYGATKLVDTGVQTLGSGAANVPWRVETTHHVRSVGASGSIWSSGYCLASLTTSVSAVSWLSMPVSTTANTSATTVDTTAGSAITIQAAFSASSASNTITTNGLLVEAIG